MQATWLTEMPKTELHLHLEGSIPIDAMHDLVRKYHPSNTYLSMDELRRRFHFKGFRHFIETWVWMNQFLREYDDFVMIANAVAKQLHDQHIRYAEVFYSPVRFEQCGLEAQRITEAIRTGFSSVQGIELALIADMVRDFGPEKAANTLKRIHEVKEEHGVIGIGLGGSEQLYPPSPFQSVFHAAKDMGFHTTAHAGEAVGPESIWGALQDLDVERIGHGMRAIEDPTLVAHLKRTQIPLEMCPLSNFRIGVASALAEYPIAHYLNAGLMVTVSTDDPAMFSNSLVDEFQFLFTEFKMTDYNVVQLAQNSITASWLPAEKKERLMLELLTYVQQLTLQQFGTELM